MPSRPFARVPRADELPGHCVRCPRDEDLIDLGAEGINGYGVIYLCSVCTAELADGLGLMAIGDHDTQVNALQLALAGANEDKAIAAQAGTYELDIEALRKDLTHGLNDALDRAARVDRPAAAGPDVPPVAEPAGEVAPEPKPVADDGPAVDVAEPASAEPEVSDGSSREDDIWAILAKPGDSEDPAASGDVAGVEGSDRVLPAVIDD